MRFIRRFYGLDSDRFSCGNLIEDKFIVESRVRKKLVVAMVSFIGGGRHGKPAVRTRCLESSCYVKRCAEYENHNFYSNIWPLTITTIWSSLCNRSQLRTKRYAVISNIGLSSKNRTGPQKWHSFSTMVIWVQHWLLMKMWSMIVILWRPMMIY